MISISVIVPVYNVEKYICRCVDSILMQTCTEYELILVDDGSPDRSGEICEEYARKDSRIIVIHKENGGLSSARNAGIDKARGEYLCFVDGDDVIHPDTLKILLRALKNNDADIAIGNFGRFYDDTELYFEMIKKSEEMKRYSGVQILEKLYDKKSAARYVSACGKLIRRTLFENIRFPEGRLFEDEFTTYLLYYKSKKITVLEEQLYYYYVNVNGITQNLTLQKWFDEYDAQWQRIIFYKEKDLQEIYHIALLAFLYSAQWHLIACRNKEEDFEEEKGKKLDQQYREVFRLARKEKIIPFMQYYDYYILGDPEHVWYYRFKRLIRKVIEKNDLK